MKTKKKIFLCNLFKYIAILIPFLAIVIINWKHWFNTQTVAGVKVSIGFVITLLTFFLCVVKILPKAPGFVWALIVGLIFYFLSSIMKDIYTMCLSESAGLFVYYFINKKQKKLSVQLGYEEQARANAEAIKQVQKELKEEDPTPPVPEETGW